MKYSFFINQKAVVDNGWVGQLKPQHVMVLETAIAYFGLKFIKRLPDPQGDFYHVANWRIVKQTAMLEISEDRCRQIITELCKLGLLERYRGNQSLKETYIRKGPKYSLMEFQKDEEFDDEFEGELPDNEDEDSLAKKLASQIPGGNGVETGVDAKNISVNPPKKVAKKANSLAKILPSGLDKKLATNNNIDNTVISSNTGIQNTGIYTPPEKIPVETKQQETAEVPPPPKKAHPLFDWKPAPKKEPDPVTEDIPEKPQQPDPLTELSQADIRWANFSNHMNEHNPHVQKMKEPITRQQYEKLRADFPGDAFKEVMRIFGEMNNKFNLTKNYVSANYTVRNWMKRSNQYNGHSTSTSPVKFRDNSGGYNVGGIDYNNQIG